MIALDPNARDGIAHIKGDEVMEREETYTDDFDGLTKTYADFDELVTPCPPSPSASPARPRGKHGTRGPLFAIGGSSSLIWAGRLRKSEQVGGRAHEAQFGLFGVVAVLLTATVAL